MPTEIWRGKSIFKKRPLERPTIGKDNIQKVCEHGSWMTKESTQYRALVLPASNLRILAPESCYFSVSKNNISDTYEEVPKSFRIGRLERELKMVQLSATRSNYIAIL
jgi:hypothetical protein